VRVRRLGRLGHHALFVQDDNIGAAVAGAALLGLVGGDGRALSA
jgi:hypothetical protein